MLDCIGWNDNPTAQQFYAAFRKLLVHNEVTASNRANCLETGVSVLTISSRRPKLHNKERLEANNNEHIYDFIAPKDDENLDTIGSILDNEDSPGICDIQLHVIAYMASMIEKEVIEMKFNRLAIKCAECIRAFSDNDICNDDFLNKKSETEDIIFPCKSTVDICYEAELVLQKYKYQSDYILTVKEILSTLDFALLYPMTNFGDHFDEHGYENHKYLFILTIIKIYVRKKQNFICRFSTQDKVGAYLRCNFKKRIHFAGQ